MKLMRVGAKGAEKPAMLDEGGTLRDLSGVVDDIAGDTLGDQGTEPLEARAQFVAHARMHGRDGFAAEITEGERVGIRLVPEVAGDALYDDGVTRCERQVLEGVLVLDETVSRRPDADGGQESVDLVFRDECAGHWIYR